MHKIVLNQKLKWDVIQSNVRINHELRVRKISSGIEKEIDRLREIIY